MIPRQGTPKHRISPRRRPARSTPGEPCAAAATGSHTTASRLARAAQELDVAGKRIESAVGCMLIASREQDPLISLPGDRKWSYLAAPRHSDDRTL